MGNPLELEEVHNALNDWRTGDKVRRLWSRDKSLWSGTDEDQWLGWLTIVDEQLRNAEQFQEIARDVRNAGFKHALLLGMGGSSLCPEVLRRTLGSVAGFPELHVLDSTVPAQVRTFEKKLDLAKALFLVSSKSGSTIEPNVLMQYFFDEVRQAVGAERAGAHFIAITDPNSKLQQVAEQDRFRRIFAGVPSIGGRFSALSNFGMVPAAIMGIDVRRFLERTKRMVDACAAGVRPEANPGVVLGVIMGTLALQGRDKVTLILSPAIAALGSWLEQLLAESTGKQGKGLVPVDQEPLGPPEVYGSDRLFVYLRLATNPSADQDAAVTAIEEAGHTVVRLSLSDAMDLGAEFFRWEIATAVAGSILGINPFDQPDVEAAKVAARKLMTAYESSGKLPTEAPLLRDGSVSLFADPRNADALESTAKSRRLESFLSAHLARLKPGDYFAINAFIEMNEQNDRELQAIRHAVRDAKHVATTLGYGPRFLHSTGQLHKGGANNGVFLEITSDDTEDVPIPGQKFSFGILKHAQAQGDFDVLAARGRRILRVHLGTDLGASLAKLQRILEQIAS